EFILVAPENVVVDESLLSTSLDVFASGGEDVQAVTWAAWLADTAGNIQDEFLTESRPMADFRAALAAHPALKDPIQMLSFLVMRKSFLEKIRDILQAIPLKEPQDISEQLFDSFWLKQGDSVRRTSLPMLIIYPPSATAAIERPGRERAREEADPSGDADKSAMREALLAYADKLEGDPYDRASILGSADLLKRMGDGGAALSMLNHYLGKNAADAEVQGLVRDWSAKAGSQAAAVPSAPAGSARASANGMPASPMHSGSVAVASVQGTSSARSVATGEPAAWSAAPGNPLAGEKVYATYAEAKPLVETVPGWLLDGQEEFLFNMAKAVPEGGHILEMGADRGRSTAAMALACSGSGKRIFSIDTFCGNDGIMGKTHDFQHEWHANLERLGVDRHCEPLKGFTFDVIPTWSGRPMLDFVFIDASHEYIDVLKDFKLIYPYVKPGGWIAFHDVEPNWPGPWRVWLERAVPLLAEHKQVATLACGRKVTGRPWEYGEKRLGFSFATNWIDHLARTIQGGEALLDTMRASMAFGSAPEADRARIL
ncbi:MAG TPA: class I SAM-dependent methyltransferase, partial [Geothrix sp.]|nr:class I SAM-dependent methyltransferase [Geothrix sp.]